MVDGRWKMEDGRWKMEDGRWKMEDGRWKMERFHISLEANLKMHTFSMLNILIRTVTEKGRMSPTLPTPLQKYQNSLQNTAIAAFL
jgi:ribosomal protein S18